MSTNYAIDTTLTGGRGTPNAWSPGSDGNDWVVKRGDQSLSFTGGKLVFTYNGDTTAGVVIYSSLTEADQEVLVNVTQGGSNADMCGAVARFVDQNNWYCAVIGESGNTLKIIKDVGGSFSTLANVGFTTTPGTTYTIRFRITGTTLKAKIWTGGSEPSTWNATATDSSLASGGFGVCGAPLSGDSVQFDTFSANNTLTSLISSTRSTFKVRAEQQDQAHTFFKVRATQSTQGRDKFLPRATQTIEGVNRYLIRAINTTLARSTFKIVGLKSLLTQSLVQFKVRSTQKTIAHSSFKTRALLTSPTQSKFLIPLRAVVLPFKSAFLVLQKTAAVFLTLQKITSSFRSPSMPQPNSTIQTSATVEDATGAPISNLSVVSVTINFPDGSSSLVGLGSGVVNAGSGVYTITYQTKTPGLVREEWKVVASDGTTTADFINTVPVSY